MLNNFSSTSGLNVTVLARFDDGGRTGDSDAIGDDSASSRERLEEVRRRDFVGVLLGIEESDLDLRLESLGDGRAIGAMSSGSFMRLLGLFSPLP